MDHRMASVDKSLIRQPGEEEIFNTRYEFPVGAGNAKSKAEMQTILPELKALDFRITYRDGWVDIWVKRDQYEQLKKATTKASDKKSLTDFFKLLPVLSLVVVLGSAILSAVTAWQVIANGWFYSNIGAVSFGTAFIRMFGICMGVYALCIVYWILNKGRAS
jgi:small-conductance mechanosensitive channel